MTEEVTDAMIEAGSDVLVSTDLELVYAAEAVTNIYLAIRSASNSPTTNGEVSEPSAPRLLPCPFCGSEGMLITHSTIDTNEYSVRCYQGCCEIGDEYEEECVTAWNTRALANQEKIND